MRQTVAPKLGALQNCLDAAPAAPLSNSLLFSSVSSIAGFSAHANYAVCNAALDAFVAYHDAAGMRTSAIQWGAWISVGAPPNPEHPAAHANGSTQACGSRWCS